VGPAEKAFRHRTRDAGFIAHMVKPVDTDALLRMIAAESRGALASAFTVQV